MTDTETALRARIAELEASRENLLRQLAAMQTEVWSLRAENEKLKAAVQRGDKS